MLHRITTLFQHRDGESSNNASQFPSLDEKINCELKKMTFLMKQSKRKLATYPPSDHLHCIAIGKFCVTSHHF